MPMAVPFKSLQQTSWSECHGLQSIRSTKCHVSWIYSGPCAADRLLVAFLEHRKPPFLLIPSNHHRGSLCDPLLERGWYHLDHNGAEPYRLAEDGLQERYGLRDIGQAEWTPTKNMKLK